MGSKEHIQGAISVCDEFSRKIGWLIADKVHIIDVTDHWNNIHGGCVKVKALDISDETFSAFVVEVQKDYHSDFHYHNQTEEIYVTKGYAVYQIGSKLHKVGEGETFRVPSGTEHKLFYPEGSKFIFRFYPPL